MCGCGRHSGGQDPPHMRSGLQQAVLTLTAAQHTCAHCLRHRPVQDIQGGNDRLLSGDACALFLLCVLCGH